MNKAFSLNCVPDYVDALCKYNIRKCAQWALKVLKSHTKGRQLQDFNEFYQETDSEVIANKPH